MTVCAWDGRILATDGGTFLGDQIAATDTVKLHPVVLPAEGACIAACSGRMDRMRPWLDQIGDDGFGRYSSEEECDAIIVSRTGMVYLAYPTGGFYKPKGPEAIGAGALLATAALRDGADAIEAVRYAIRHHVYCAGTIRAYDWQSNVIVRIKQ